MCVFLTNLAVPAVKQAQPVYGGKTFVFFSVGFPFCLPICHREKNPSMLYTQDKLSKNAII